MYKEPEVVATQLGILADFLGPDPPPGGHLTWDAWTLVVEELPRLGLKESERDPLWIVPHKAGEHV